MADTTYNGWENYETWNVARWLQDDTCLSAIMTQFAQYKTPYQNLRRELKVCVFNFTRTPDGTDLYDPRLDIDALDDMIAECID